MREIKFRAWDKNRKTMITAPNRLSISHVEGRLTVFDHKQNGDQIDCDLMQYTGLKDKNGKDLFEGDNLYVVDEAVVETIGGYPRTEPEGRTETIKYERGAFWWGEELLWEVAEHGEVISNIYESETR